MPLPDKIKTKIRKGRLAKYDYTKEDLLKALKEVRAGKGIMKVSRFYRIPEGTIRYRLISKKQENLSSRHVPILGFDGEEKIVDWIKQSAKCGLRVKKGDLLDLVSALAKHLNKEKFLTLNGRPGKKWYQNFVKRHPELSFQVPKSMNEASDAVKEASIRKWFSDLELYLTERGFLDVLSDPKRILYASETGISFSPIKEKVLAQIVKKKNKKDMITVMIVMTASAEIGPPLIVYKKTTPPKVIVEGTLLDWFIGRSETGWVESDVFYEYIANDFNRWLTDQNVKKPVILFVDRHKPHMSMPLSKFCNENGIILYALPPNTTLSLQPIDIYQIWRKTQRKWERRSENLKKMVTKSNFCKVFKEALNDELTETIKSGFRKCGLYPFDVEQINFNTVFMPTLKSVKDEPDSEDSGQEMLLKSVKDEPESEDSGQEMLLKDEPDSEDSGQEMFLNDEPDSEDSGQEIFY